LTLLCSLIRKNEAFSLASTPISTVLQVLLLLFAAGNPFNGRRKGVHKPPSSASLSLILFEMPDPDPLVLLPIVNGALANFRKKDVKFVRVQLMLDYASMVNVNPPGATVLRTEFYIKLPLH
jgi:hypothetical protein